jgi:DNA polymerase-3 subunit gamma/tau
MSYQVLARKWRPRDFASLVGQEHVVRALSHALQQQRLHHAYLFTGTRGVGKTTLSRVLAKALNCVGPDGAGGITAQPCNRCEVCTAIDGGRFVDYIEMDAASNRGVDEMTALLERSSYAPSNARFKVYMIDEVHMLTTHAFNAMLKTLEEPPEYVKFILATTDPQKLPVTVLSRCLQFNLKQMTPVAVAGRLAEILREESIAAEPAALAMLGHAARGSMRDGLSLLDQAIAYSGGNVTLQAVRDMLGAIDTTVLLRLLEALAARDAAAMLAVADEMAGRSLSFAQGLRDLGSLLHRLALQQQVPDWHAEESEHADALARLARTFAPDEVQLYYQIALHGRNDLHLAPDEYAGFTMALLRMLAFAPAAEPAAARAAASAALVAAKPPRTAVPAAAPRAVGVAAAPAVVVPPAVRRSEAPMPAPAPAAAAIVQPSAVQAFDGDWAALAARLPVGGLVRELAVNSALVAVDGDHVSLAVPIKALADSGNVERLRAALSRHWGREIRLKVDVGAAAGPTAAAAAAKARAEKQRRAEEAIYADPLVQRLIDDFDAQVDPASIRPRET